jgi:DNA polymerase-3 subunit beta
MKFTVSREDFLKPLQLVVGVVERRQTLPILSNVLIGLSDGRLSLTGTDLEVEILGYLDLGDSPVIDGEITVPGRKLMDICRSLPEGAELTISVDAGRATVTSGRSRFTLSTLPANEFPSVEDGPGNREFSLSQHTFKQLLDSTAFAMRDAPLENLDSDAIQVIIPRKGVLELSRLLVEDAGVEVVLGNNHIRVSTPEFRFTSKLVDGAYPDYQRVLPKGGNKQLIGRREELRQAFSRTAILSNEKYRGVRLLLSDGLLTLTANNPEQEEAQEDVAVNYDAGELEIGFNVSYVIDVLNVLRGEEVRFTLSDANSSALIEDPATEGAVYVVMPMRL